MKHIKITEKAKQKLLKNFSDEKEVGGLLIGRKRFFNKNSYIVNRVLTLEGKEGKSSFVCEPNLKKIERCMVLPYERILGIWHTHPLGDDVFSLADEETNKKYADFLKGCISILVYSRKNYTVYYIDNDGIVSRILK